MGAEAQTATDGVAAGQLGRPRSVADLDGLVRALRLLGAALLPVALVTGLIWAAVYLVFRMDPDRTRYLVRSGSLSHAIIEAQIARIQKVAKPSLAFVGDSSCLMGIHVPTLRRALSDDGIESFCTIAHVGPVGYARMIEMLLERGAAPDRLVIAMHPASFFREPYWDWATKLVMAEGRTPEYDTDRLVGALAYVRAKWIDPIVSKPMGNPYGLYYGGYPSVAATIHADHGSAADPQSALAVPSIEDFSRTVDVSRRPAITSYPYVPNAAFNDSIEVLAKAVTRLGRARVYLLLMPLSDYAFSTETERAHDATAQDMARRLGLSASHVLSQEGHVPNEYLSDAAHMNRWGRILYTKALARHLAPSADTASH